MNSSRRSMAGLDLYIGRNILVPDDTVKRDKWVLNIASKPLNTIETLALQKGTNFALAPKKNLH